MSRGSPFVITGAVGDSEKAAEQPGGDTGTAWSHPDTDPLYCTDCGGLPGNMPVIINGVVVSKLDTR